VVFLFLLRFPRNQWPVIDSSISGLITTKTRIKCRWVVDQSSACFLFIGRFFEPALFRVGRRSIAIDPGAIKLD